MLKPHHLTIGEQHTTGNGGAGRVFLLPGSHQRARRLAGKLSDVETIESPRGLDVHLGHTTLDGVTADVGVVATGMGCPSVGIIVTELIMLGAKLFCRVGTSGSLQVDRVRAGHLVIATAAVCDEGASDSYAPREVPAVAHPDWNAALKKAALGLGLGDCTWAGTVHSKDSLYGREFGLGPMKEQNAAYLKLLTDLGVMATEMESSHLFTLAAAHAPDIRPLDGGAGLAPGIKAGSVLAVVGDSEPFAAPEVAALAETRLIDVAIRSAVHLIAG